MGDFQFMVGFPRPGASWLICSTVSFEKGSSAVKPILIAAAALLYGCASSEKLQAQQEMPNFRVGYGDGCLTAGEEQKSFSTKVARDSYLFQNDAAYRAGWRRGYFDCSHTIPDASDGGSVLGERNEF
jgi:hypothetical protein